MRINVYSQELTDEVVVVEKVSNTGVTYYGVQLILHSSDRLHHPPEDDDRSAVTFWLPKSFERRDAMAQAFEVIAKRFRSLGKEEASFVCSQVGCMEPARWGGGQLRCEKHTKGGGL